MDGSVTILICEGHLEVAWNPLAAWRVYVGEDLELEQWETKRKNEEREREAEVKGSKKG